MVRHEIRKVSGPSLHQARHGGQTTRILHGIGVLWEGNLNSQDLCELQSRMATKLAVRQARKEA